MASLPVPQTDSCRARPPAATLAEADRLARRDLLILRLEVGRRRRRQARRTGRRLRIARLVRLSG